MPDFMPDNSIAAVFHSNRYAADSACEHCGGVIRHERWCITVDQTVYYAYEIVADPGKVSVGDAINLHALGVLWVSNKCGGAANTVEHRLSRSNASQERR
jgi:hypothetical protein